MGPDTCVRCTGGKLERIIPTEGGGWAYRAVDCDHGRRTDVTGPDPDFEYARGLELRLAAITRLVGALASGVDRSRPNAVVKSAALDALVDAVGP